MFSSVLTEIASPIIIRDLRYTTENNFTGKTVSKREGVFLRAEPARQLYRVLDDLKRRGMYLVVWDSFRTQAEQNVLSSVEDAEWVSKKSNHSRGVAVDVSLANSKKEYLDMGTDFDNFTKKARPYSKSITEEQLSNRKLLRGIMAQYGFGVSRIEWWHFNYTKLKNTVDIVDLEVQ